MKLRLCSIFLFIALFFTGCMYTSRAQLSEEERFNMLNSEQTTAPNEMALISATTTVKHGDKANVTIQGKQGTRYTINAVYNKDGKTLTTTHTKTAGADGRVNWVWDVDPKTAPGSYSITVIGGGGKLTFPYTVTK